MITGDRKLSKTIGHVRKNSSINLKKLSLAKDGKIWASITRTTAMAWNALNLPKCINKVINGGKESRICIAILIQILALDNLVIKRGKSSLYKMQTFHVINEEDITESNYHYFIVPDKLMNLSTDSQWLLT